MIRMFKALGFALVAVLVTGAVIASSSSAATFHSEKAVTILTEENEGINIFTVTSSSFKVECATVQYKGTSLNESGSTTTKTVTLHPIYTNCITPLGKAPVDTTGCNYVFGSETTTSGDLPVETECTTGSAIMVTAPGCTMTFEAQKNGGGVSVVDLGSGTSRDTTTVSTIGATFTRSGFACGLVPGNTGTYSGATTLKGYVDNGTSGKLDEDSAVYTEGAQVGIWWE